MARPQHAEPRERAARGLTGRIGRVAELWRYPVKMRGTIVAELMVGERGGLGDRAPGAARSDQWPHREREAVPAPARVPGRVRGGADLDDSRPGRIEAPGGQVVYADEPEASDLISSTLGWRFRLERPAGLDERTGIDGAPYSAMSRSRV